MGLMDEILASDAAVFIDADGFPGVEQVTLTFQDATTRTVYADVFREGVEDLGGGYRPRILVSFRNHATLGLLPTELDGGGVITVTLAERHGETAKATHLRRCTDPDKPADAGMVWAEVG